MSINMFIKGLALGDWIINRQGEIALFIEYYKEGAIGIYEQYRDKAKCSIYSHQGWRQLTTNEKHTLKAKLKKQRNPKPEEEKDSIYERSSL